MIGKLIRAFGDVRQIGKVASNVLPMIDSLERRIGPVGMCEYRNLKDVLRGTGCFEEVEQSIPAYIRNSYK
jgi:hypothetical protein